MRRGKTASASLLKNTSGNVLLTLAAALPVLMGAIGIATDYAMLYKMQSEMQAAADAAALAAAHEIPLAKSNLNQLVNSATAFAQFQLDGKASAASPAPETSGSAPAVADSPIVKVSDAITVTDDGGGDGSGGGGSTDSQRTSGGDDDDESGSGAVTDSETPYQIAAAVVDGGTAVNVEIAKEWTPFFAHFLKADITPVRVTATARFVGSANICVLGLSPKTVAGVTLWNSARLTGKNCGVYSNTASASGLVVRDAGMLASALNCVAGGYKIDGALSVTPLPITDCPPVEDPLRARPGPAVGGCDHDSLVVASENRTLSPGVYCGGLVLSGTSQVTLDPGIYVIKDGPLVVKDTASMMGDGAGFYLTGAGSVAWFTAKTTISLSAPTDGELAGLLFFEDRAVSGVRLHRIASNNARKLLGTIYLSKSILNIDSNAPVADQSAYTAIVTQSLQLQSGPDLILNTDYDLTDVPVPDGISGSSRVILSN